MNYSKITVRYSKAIFILAKEKDILDKVKDDMLFISRIIQEISEFAFMLTSPVIQASQKEKALAKIFDNKLSTETMSLLSLIVKNKREEYIPDIARNYIELYRKEKGIKSVTLTTAIEIDKDLKEKLIKIIKEFYKSEIELKSKVNQDIIGGFVISVDDKQLDASVSKKLKDLEREFINTTFEYKILG